MVAGRKQRGATILTARLLVGDARDILSTLPERSVHMVCTSPPYFGLRDYGTAQWDGGDAGCDHRGAPLASPNTTLGMAKGNGSHEAAKRYAAGSGGIPYRDICGKCGAVRLDRQIGLEGSLSEYITTLVAVFRSVWRVLRDDGSLYLNLGDSYAGSWGAQGRNGQMADRTVTLSRNQIANHPHRQSNTGTIRDAGLKPKDLMMVPARVALALQADGWYLRADIIWAKRAPMPESVTDRPTSAHEHVFLLTKKPRYYFDMEAVKEESSPSSAGNRNIFRGGGGYTNGNSFNNAAIKPNQIPGNDGDPAGRNIRNVWHLGPEPYPAAHFATFVTEIPRRAILAGTSERGCCPACGAPYRRHVERTVMEIRRTNWGEQAGNRTASSGTMTKPATSQTIGWQPGCICDAGNPIPAVVLDPFGGSGTTSLVADRLGRDSIYIDLSAEYAAMAKRRIYEDAPLFAEVVTP
jgi:DNA modification methylase